MLLVSDDEDYGDDPIDNSLPAIRRSFIRRKPAERFIAAAARRSPDWDNHTVAMALESPEKSNWETAIKEELNVERQKQTIHQCLYDMRGYTYTYTQEPRFLERPIKISILSDTVSNHNRQSCPHNLVRHLNKPQEVKMFYRIPTIFFKIEGAD